MQTPSREEMIRMARETRKQVTNAAVPEELMRQFPVTMKEMTIPFEEGDIPVYYSYPGEMRNPDVLILNFHGGGFIRARTPNDELFCRRMNHALSCKVLDVDYAIAPDDPFPVAVHQSYYVFNWVREHAAEWEINPEKLVLMGHSAGGNLVIGAVMRALENGTPLPALLVSAYPPLDVYTDPADKQSMGKGIPPERARLYNLYYCERELQKDPYCSPLYAPDEMLRGFPPTLILTAGLDALCNEAEDFALRLARNFNEVTCKRFANVDHGFTIYRREGCDAGYECMFRFVKNGLGLKEGT